MNYSEQEAVGAFIIGCLFDSCCILKGLTKYRIEEFSKKSRRSYFDFLIVPEAGGGMRRERGRKWERGQSEDCGALSGEGLREATCSVGEPQMGPRTERPAQSNTH